VKKCARCGDLTAGLRVVIGLAEAKPIPCCDHHNGNYFAYRRIVTCGTPPGRREEMIDIEWEYFGPDRQRDQEDA